MPTHALLFATIACSPGQDLGPTGSAPAARSDGTGEAVPVDITLDDELVRIGTRIVGFGGLYVDSGRVTVLLTDANPALVTGQTSSLQQAIAESPGELRWYAELPIRIIAGTYLFSDLAAWRWSMDSLSLHGAVFSDIDERLNRVVIGLRSDADIRAAELRLQGTNIPTAAVRFERAVPLKPLTLGQNYVDSLQGTVRPTVGGVQIQLDPPAGGGRNCTLTGNVVWVGGPAGEYFVTNSHCSQFVFGLDAVQGNVWHQPSTSFEVVATQEVVDPPLFSGGACTPGKLCRYSDATLVRYSNASYWQGAFIARPVFQIAPFEFVLRSQLVIGGVPPVNTVAKVGAYSGETAGTPSRTCVHHDLPSDYYAPHHTIPSNTRLLCQNEANLNSVGGDSGAPLFQPLDQFSIDYVKFRGSLFAGDGQLVRYSPLSGIRLDLGNIRFDLF